MAKTRVIKLLSHEAQCFRPSLFRPPQRLRYSSQTKRRDVRILEVGPRDGLQNIQQFIPSATKVELIQRLAETGLRDIEAASFVSPKWVPQLRDGAQVMSEIAPLYAKYPVLRFPVLAPNLRGLDNAVKAGAKEVVVFASATEAFSKANQNCTVEEALSQAEKVARQALRLGVRVRGSVYTIQERAPLTQFAKYDQQCGFVYIFRSVLGAHGTARRIARGREIS